MLVFSYKSITRLIISGFMDFIVVKKFVRMKSICTLQIEVGFFTSIIVLYKN